MAVSQITHSTPATYPRGIQDLGARTISPTAPAVPTFFPHVYTFAAKGPVGEPFPMVGSTVTSNFGSEVFDDGSDYATHQSVAARLINATGCAQMWQRVIAKDLPANLLAKGYTNASTARLVLWLEVSDQFQVTQYARTPAGKYTNAAAPVVLLDGAGDPIKVDGRAIRWVVTSTDQNGDEITGDVGGLESITYSYSAVGTKWFAAPNKDTTRYPIMEIAARGPGKHYNKCGVRIWPSVYTDNDAPTSAEMRATGGFYYKMAFVRRAKPTTTPLLVSAIDLSTSRFVSLEERIRNDATSAKMSVEDIFSQAYTTSSDPIIYGDVGDVHIYHNYIALIQTQLYNTERDFGQGGDAAGIAAYATTARNFDFKSTEDAEKTMLNLLTARSLRDIPYYTIKLETEHAGSLLLTDETNVMFAGGSDGTMNLEVFDYVVEQEALKYADPTNPLMNRARFDQSCVLDTGFGVTTKQALTNIIALRKDTYFLGTPVVVGDSQLSIAEEQSRAITLRTTMQNLPESDYYGTASVRGCLIGREGDYLTSEYPHRLPLAIEVMQWCAKFMGASNGKWKSTYLFDMQPNNIFQLFANISNSWTPADVRKEDWLTAGMNFPLDKDRTQAFLPGFRSIYNEETSPLTSMLVVMACAELQKVMERVHAELVGAIRFTPGQLIEAANNKIAQYSQDRFAGLFVIKPACYISEGDAERGYSWSTKVEIYANNMKTATTIDLSLFRMEDYVA